jgi:MFS family permease
MTTSPASRAAWAIFAIFLIHGILLGSWVPHIPLAKERLGVGPGLFGLALLSIAGGAVIAMPVAGALINRLGSARVTLLGGIGFCLCVALPILAPAMPAFVVGGFILGASIGSMDVAMNAHGIAVERATRYPIMSKLHGGFSVGGLAGAGLAAWLLTYLSEWQHILAVSGICLAALVVCASFLLPASADKGLSKSMFALPSRTTLGLGALCFLALMAEGAVLDWAAIYFRDEFALPAGTAALSYALFSGGMAGARLSGDWLRVKLGAVPMVAGSALLTAAAITAGIFSPSFMWALAAFTVAGIGIGNIAPVLFAGGGRLEPDAPGRGIAAVTTLGYAGFLAGPPIIGFVAQVSDLGTALFLIVFTSLIISAFSGMARAADTY